MAFWENVNYLDAAITEVKEDKSSSTAQDWTESQLFFRLHRIRGIYPKGNVEALAIQQLITVRPDPLHFVPLMTHVIARG
jgi:hypothetical protein